MGGYKLNLGKMEIIDATLKKPEYDMCHICGVRKATLKSSERPSLKKLKPHNTEK